MFLSNILSNISGARGAVNARLQTPVTQSFQQTHGLTAPECIGPLGPKLYKTYKTYKTYVKTIRIEGFPWTELTLACTVLSFLVILKFSGVRPSQGFVGFFSFSLVFSLLWPRHFFLIFYWFWRTFHNFFCSWWSLHKNGCHARVHEAAATKQTTMEGWGSLVRFGQQSKAAHSTCWSCCAVTGWLEHPAQAVCEVMALQTQCVASPFAEDKDVLVAGVLERTC